jgi:hypothetical protein
MALYDLTIPLRNTSTSDMGRAGQRAEIADTIVWVVRTVDVVMVFGAVLPPERRSIESEQGSVVYKSSLQLAVQHWIGGGFLPDARLYFVSSSTLSC